MTPDCRRCGACCMGQLIILTAKDRGVPALMLTDDGFAMRQQMGMCVAFDGRLAIDARCTIYADRPEICRVLPPGSSACLQIRQEMGVFS